MKEHRPQSGVVRIKLVMTCAWYTLSAQEKLAVIILPLR